ncbi:hypothetical protein KGQ33_05345 [Patescibacteria group bacterium]|nr:hypothetical protein [Patescibacteria group bacterium]
MATTTISSLSAVLAANLTDLAVLAVDDANANTRKATIAQLRTQLLVGLAVPASQVTTGTFGAGVFNFPVSPALTVTAEPFNGSAYGGIILNKAGTDTTNFPSVTYQITGAPKWAVGVDIANADFVLAYDWTLAAGAGGDVFRMSPSSGVAGRTQLVFGPHGIGSPAVYTYSMTLETGTFPVAGVDGLTIQDGNGGIRLDLLESYNSTVFGVAGFSGGAIGTRTNQSLMFGTNNVAALTIDNTQTVIVASGKAFQVGNAFVATPATSAGYIIIKDSGGVDRKVMVGT